MRRIFADEQQLQMLLLAWCCAAFGVRGELGLHVVNKKKKGRLISSCAARASRIRAVSAPSA
jgi:hypothetical protein